MEKEQGLLQSVKVNITGVIIILRELSLKKKAKKRSGAAAGKLERRTRGNEMNSKISMCYYRNMQYASETLNHSLGVVYLVRCNKRWVDKDAHSSLESSRLTLVWFLAGSIQWGFFLVLFGVTCYANAMRALEGTKHCRLEYGNKELKFAGKLRGTAVK